MDFHLWKRPGFKNIFAELFLNCFQAELLMKFAHQNSFLAFSVLNFLNIFQFEWARNFKNIYSLSLLIKLFFSAVFWVYLSNPLEECHFLVLFSCLCSRLFQNVFCVFYSQKTGEKCRINRGKEQISAVQSAIFTNKYSDVEDSKMLGT